MPSFKELQQENETLENIIEEMHCFYVLEDARINKERKKWFNQRVSKYIRGKNNGNISNYKTD